MMLSVAGALVLNGLTARQPWPRRHALTTHTPVAHAACCLQHSFRPAYRQLGSLREVLPDVPIMALTATATQRVQQV